MSKGSNLMKNELAVTPKEPVRNNLEEAIKIKKKALPKPYDTGGFLHSYKLQTLTRLEFKRETFDRYSYMSRVKKLK